MFLSGADGRTPELRPPSIKGMLRFWWRAIQAENNFDKLNEIESKIFGSSDTGKSKVTIRINHNFIDNVGESLWEEIPHIIKQSRTGKNYNDPTDRKWLQYFFYSTLLNERPYFIPHTKFEITLSSYDSDCLRSACNAFWCLSFFGGVGTRSRRGGGNIYAKPLESDPTLYKFFNTADVTDKEKMKIFILEGINKISPNKNPNNEYSIIKGSKIYFFNPMDNWKNALESIAKPFFHFRSSYHIKSRIDETPNFGFPVNHGGRNRGPRITMGAAPKKPIIDTNGNVKNFLERSSSPLIFRIIKTGDKIFFPIIIHLNSKLIPDNYDIMDNKGYNAASLSNTIIDEFFRSIGNPEAVVL